MLWEANFHRLCYNLVPLGEYIYLGGNIKLRTAIKTAGILLPVFLFYQIQCWWWERHFFTFQTFPLPTLAFQWWPSVCATPLPAIVETRFERCCAGQRIPAAGGVGLAGDAARVLFTAPALHFWWSLMLWIETRVSVSVTGWAKYLVKMIFPFKRRLKLERWGGADYVDQSLCCTPTVLPSNLVLAEPALSQRGVI